jgi:glycosyltransferase involved in cell wall biosynthesis
MYSKIKRKLKIFIKDIYYDILKGNETTINNFFYKYKAHFKKLKTKITNKLQAKKTIKAKEDFYQGLLSYIREVEQLNKKDFIFLFSGTTFIQEKRGNRPIRLTNAWIKEGIPVLFSYYRWNQAEEIPSNNTKGLYQIPIDYTMEWMDELINIKVAVHNKVFIVSFPYPPLARYIGKLELNGWKIIYDVRDNWEEFHKVNMAKWYDKSMEKFFVCNSRVTCCVAKPLQQKMQEYTKTKIVRLSPNALDEGFYKQIEGLKTDRIEKEDSLKEESKKHKMIVGYVGHLSSSWFDWEGLIQVAKERPQWNFEIIGHFEPKGMNMPSNIKLLGSKEHREIKQITNTWKVAIIPFKIGALSDCVDPIKIYEYLAMELPVVSFRMPQIHDYPNTFIAYSVEQFAQKIEEASLSKFDYEQNRLFLEKNTWSIRANELLEWARAIDVSSDFL